MPPFNIHATAIVLGDRGILISGQSGSGKTTLALTLLGMFAARQRFSRIVGDDQLLVSACSGRLVVRCPEAIAGLAEVHGVGPRPLPYLASAVIDLVVRLVPPGQAERFAEPSVETIAGIEVPQRDLAARHAASAALTVSAWLEAPPFR